MLRTEIDSMPAELDELTRRVMRLRDSEEAALAKEKDEASRTRPRDPCAASWPTCAPRPTPCGPSGRRNAKRCERCSRCGEEIERVRLEAEAG